MTYILQDNYGMPQCGYDELEFADWGELIDHIESTPGLEDRLFEGYAFLQERNQNEDL
jgi:hypothetical protein